MKMIVSLKKRPLIAGLSLLLSMPTSVIFAAETAAGHADNSSVISAATAENTDRVDTLSQRLIVLRGEVEDLSAELTMQREEDKQSIAALLSQRSEIQARAGRENRNQDKLKKLLEKNREKARLAGTNNSALIPVLLNAITEMENVVAQGLPFQLQERLVALKSIRDQLNSGVLSPPRAANRLWAFCEDELHLTRENGLYRQTIDIDGESLLVDVARLGMVMMYFRTPDQHYGMAVRTNNNWHFEPIIKEEDSQHVSLLFESLQKQIRTGIFDLPSAI